MYNLTIILPFHQKYAEFKYALPYNYNEYKKAKEIIILIDHTLDRKKLAFLEDYDLNFKIFNNKVDHPWRNPAVTINKGIDEASGKYVMIFSPESILFNNIIDNLYKNTNETTYSYGNVSFMTKNFFETESYSKFLTIFQQENNSLVDKEHKSSTMYSGLCNPKSSTMYSGLCNPKSSENPIIKNTNPLRFDEYWEPYKFGSICVSKKNLNLVGNYNDKLVLWGGDDNNIRDKLELNNIKGCYLKDSNIIHLEFVNKLIQYSGIKNKNSKIYSGLYKFISYDDKKRLLSNSIFFEKINTINYQLKILNNSQNKINLQTYKKKNILTNLKNIVDNEIYNYIYKNFLLQKYSEVKSLKFDKFTHHKNIIYKELSIPTITEKIKDSNDLIKEVIINKQFSKNIDILLLVPCYNEKDNINDFINNTKQFADEIIVLDDGSTDNSWDLIKDNSNIGIKLSKNRDSFNDKFWTSG